MSPSAGTDPLIVVLRAVVAVSNAVIAVLELIRQYFD
ncbi:DinQ-like type I toxin DqlB [Enterobacter hormaechei]|nr:DinQ-like type I toxin DqlB [Enterobacter hormaechei]